MFSYSPINKMFGLFLVLTTVVPLFHSFAFPWFQLPGVNCGPEADDPSSDIYSEGPNATS